MVFEVDSHKKSDNSLIKYVTTEIDEIKLYLNEL